MTESARPREVTEPKGQGEIGLRVVGDASAGLKREIAWVSSTRIERHGRPHSRKGTSTSSSTSSPSARLELPDSEQGEPGSGVSLATREREISSGEAALRLSKLLPCTARLGSSIAAPASLVRSGVH